MLNRILSKTVAPNGSMAGVDPKMHFAYALDVAFLAGRAALRARRPI